MLAASTRKLKSLKTAIEKIDAEVKLHHYKIRNYQPHVNFSFERGDYLVKTAETGEELEACLKLRFEVFHREYRNSKRTSGIDIDKLDYICDHLMIIDQRDGKTIGTYRLNSSQFNDIFYSENEFEISKVLELPGNKLELGRACIDREFRNGVIIALLWRGIAEYIQMTETKVLFGCASVKTMEPMEIGLMTHYLRENSFVDDSYRVHPTRKYQVRQLSRALEYIGRNRYEYIQEEVKAKLPALFLSYLKAGAKVCGEPALDREFACIDYLIVLKVDEMSSKMKGKYKV